MRAHRKDDRLSRSEGMIRAPSGFRWRLVCLWLAATRAPSCGYGQPPRPLRHATGRRLLRDDSPPSRQLRQIRACCLLAVCLLSAARVGGGPRLPFCPMPHGADRRFTHTPHHTTHRSNARTGDSGAAEGHTDKAAGIVAGWEQAAAQHPPIILSGHKQQPRSE